jgi:hypothetical protein
MKTRDPIGNSQSESLQAIDASRWHYFPEVFRHEAQPDPFLPALGYPCSSISNPIASIIR